MKWGHQAKIHRNLPSAHWPTPPVAPTTRNHRKAPSFPFDWSSSSNCNWLKSATSSAHTLNRLPTRDFASNRFPHTWISDGKEWASPNWNARCRPTTTFVLGSWGGNSHAIDEAQAMPTHILIQVCKLGKMRSQKLNKENWLMNWRRSCENWAWDCVDSGQERWIVLSEHGRFKCALLLLSILWLLCCLRIWDLVEFGATMF
jgi:hypothetical protein